MEPVPLDCGILRSVSYRDTLNRLEVELRSGGRYRYYGVPRYEYELMLRAASPAEYLAQVIRPAFRYDWLG